MKNLILLFALCSGLAVSAYNTPTDFKTNPKHTYVTESGAFCILIQNGNYAAVKGMIDVGINVNAKSLGLTPLMYAARQNKVEIVKLLLASGANIKIKGDRGYTAIQWAKMSKAHDTFAILKKEQQVRKALKKAKRKRK